MSNPYPHELGIGEIYFSPLIAAMLLAFLATLVTVMILNKLKLSRYFFAPSYIFIAIMTLYLILVDTFWIKF